MSDVAASLLESSGWFVSAGLSLYVYFAFFLMVLARQTATANSWLAWIPIASLYLMCRVGRRSPLLMVLLLVPFLNFLVLGVIWWGIARARSKPGWTGLLILIPPISLVLPWYLVSGPANSALMVPDSPPSPEPVPVAVAPTSGPTACPQCGMIAQPNHRFCGECGFDLSVARQAPVTLAERPVATAPFAVPPQRSRFATGVVGVLAVLALAGGYVLANTFASPAPRARQAPAMPTALAGTLTEFPLDHAAEGTVRPDAVVTQQIDGGAQHLTVPASWLPPGVTSDTIITRAASLTAATYRAQPSDAPVIVVVLSDESSELGPVLTQDVLDAENGDEVGIAVESAKGESYLGSRVTSDQRTVYILSKRNSPIVIMIYAPVETGAPVAARLAANVGNGGLAQDPAVQSALWSLPSEVPSDLVFEEAHTYSSGTIAAANDQLAQLGTALGDAPQQWIAEARRLLPASVVIARYHDRQQRDYTVVRGDYGSSARAWALWTAVRWIVGGAAVDMRLDRGNGDLLSAGDQSVVMFQAGSSLVFIMAPKEPPDGSQEDNPVFKIRLLADRLQL